MSNGAQIDFIKQRVEIAMNNALATRQADHTCPSHDKTIEVGVTSLQLGEMMLDMQVEQSQKIDMLIQQRRVTYRIVQLLGALCGTTGIAGSAFYVISWLTGG